MLIEEVQSTNQRNNLNELGAVLGNDIAEKRKGYFFIFSNLFGMCGFLTESGFLYFDFQTFQPTFVSNLSRWWRRSSVSDVKEPPTFKITIMIMLANGQWLVAMMKIALFYKSDRWEQRCHPFSPIHLRRERCSAGAWKRESSPTHLLHLYNCIQFMSVGEPDSRE